MAALKATLAFGKQLAEKGLIPATNKASPLFGLSKYMKYGLLSDDLTKENATTKEALRRLPKDVFQERQFRHAKAINVSGNKDVLPQSEWIKPEQDVPYLRPFVQQVVAEQKEIEDWEAGKFY